MFSNESTGLKKTNNKIYQIMLSAFILFFFLLLSGCGGDSGAGSVSTSYPHLTSTPQISYIQNIYNTSQYDVTVTLDADGPDGVFAVDLWLFSKDDAWVFEHLDLVYTGGGTTWSATTNIFLSLPAGNYYIESINVEDADPFANGIVKSSWYISNLFSDSYYGVDQRETDWSTVNILNNNLGTSNIPVVNFTLP